MMTLRTLIPSGFKHILINITPFRKIPLRRKFYYSILGLKAGASSREIKEAYYKLSKMYHPDMNFGHDDATGKIQEINEAFETLGNTQKKQAYDALNLPNLSQEPCKWKGSFIYDMEPKFYQYRYEAEEEPPKHTFEMEQNNYQFIKAQYLKHHRGIVKRKWRHTVQKYLYQRERLSHVLNKSYTK